LVEGGGGGGEGGDFKWFFPTKNQILSNLKLILILKDLNNFATL